jgi:hypothetical protein
VGDTLYAALEIDELAPNRSTGVVGLATTVHNQAGLLVMSGRQRYLLRKRGDPSRDGVHLLMAGAASALEPSAGVGQPVRQQL